MIIPALAFLDQYRDPSREKKSKYAHYYIVTSLIGIWIANFTSYTITVCKYYYDPIVFIMYHLGAAVFATLISLYFYCCLKSYAEFDDVNAIIYGQQYPGVDIYMQQPGYAQTGYSQPRYAQPEVQ